MQLRILLLFGLHTLGTNSAVVKRDVGPDLSGINLIRKQVGEYAGVEMPELEWDEGLARKAEMMPNDCEQLRHGSDYRVFPDAPDEDAQKLVDLYYNLLLIAENATDAPKVDKNVEDTAKIFIDVMNYGLSKGTPDDNVSGFELLNPAQNKVGCARTKCTSDVSDLKSIKTKSRMPPELEIDSDKVVFNSICLLGPSNKWSWVLQITSAIPKVEALKGGKISFKMGEPSSADTSQTLLALYIALLVIFFQ